MSLQLFDDIDMVLFIEKGIRGGITQCSNRYMKPENFKTMTLHLLYYNVNNLYGLAMMHPLPYGHFEWVGEKNLNTTY